MRPCGNELLVLERDRESRKDRRLDKKKIAQSHGFETTTAHTSHVDHVHRGHVTSPPSPQVLNLLVAHKKITLFGFDNCNFIHSYARHSG